MEPKQPTLDQLQIFLAIVETGSFAAAARRLGRATSVISYAIANLEAQLGLELFDRGAARTPQLTEAGRAVLADARSIASLDAWDNVAYPLQAVHRSDRALGPAARWLLERLTGNCRRAEAKWTPVRVTQTPQKPKPPLQARRSGNGG